METKENISEKKYNAIVTYAPVPLAEINEAGEIQRLNIMGQQLLDPLFTTYRLPPTHLFPLLDCICPGVADLIRNFKQPYGRITFNFVQTFNLQPPIPPIERYFQYNINKIFKDCIMVGIDDLTQRYDEEKAMQQNILDKAITQAKLEMAAEILHDIGNAITGFSSYYNRLRQVFKPDIRSGLNEALHFLKKQREKLRQSVGDDHADALIVLLESIEQITTDTQRTTKQVLDEQQNIISHIQGILDIHRQYVSGHSSQSRKPINLNDLVNDSCAMIQESCQKRGIRLTLSLPSAVPLVKADRVRLMQVMLNVLKNSVEAITVDSPHQKQITVTLTCDDDDVIIIIEDTGSGFNKEAAARLFERGYTTKTFGAGLGLYNCRSILESHAGTIDVCNGGHGMGAKATIRFSNKTIYDKSI